MSSFLRVISDPAFRRQIVSYFAFKKFKILGAISITIIICLLVQFSFNNDKLNLPGDEQVHIKTKEYPDFDYKYDKKSKQNAKVLPDSVDTIIDDSSSIKQSYQRRKSVLNGIHTGDVDVFDVIGGADLFHDHRPSRIDEFAADEAKIVPGLGDGGEGVDMTPDEAAKAEKIMSTEAFNLIASDKISLHRIVPDTRDPLCKNKVYDTNLPSTSVIIIFTNEAWSPLLRTIWSVLDNTPEEFLHEIILVDDFSDKKHLKGKLERYIQKKLPSKVKLLRLKKREGLIRARLEGAKVASGEVILFLDSHCECGPTWLEPLIQRIKENRKAFVVPIIDVIDDKTMEYYHGNGNYFQIGGFTWSGHFTWIDIPEHERNRRKSIISPTRTPTMAGGLFAVNREYFWESGSYDEDMDVWGGENLEMSFRIWQCGGVLETIPCSRVGHIFRSFHPYSFPGNKDTHGINTARTFEVWLDDYKRLFYMNRPDLQNIDIGNISKRMRFKNEYQCKPFQWYLDNIYPQKFILDSPKHVFAYGRVKNIATSMCFDTMQNDEKDSYDLGIYPCHDYMAASQFFSFSRNFEIRREDSCAEVDSLSDEGKIIPVQMRPCHGQGNDQEWNHMKDGRIIHKQSNKCLDPVQGKNAQQLYAAPCKATKTQIWFFDKYIDTYNDSSNA